MSVAVFSAVLATALFHAGWNFAVKKSSGNKIAVIWLGQLLAGLVVLPIALLCTDFSLFSTSWLKFIVATGVIHSVYIALLGWSYTVGDISVVYPVARGVGILGTSLIAILFGIDQVSHLGIAGILLIVLGIVFIGLKEIPHAARRVALGIAIAVGLTITCYSLVDKLATKEIPPLFYATVLNISSALFCAPLIFLKYSQATLETAKTCWREVAIVGFGGIGTYVIILWAFQFGPVSYVVALRETSVVIATALGVWLLKEQMSKRKALGIAAILLGAILIRMA